MLNHKTENMRHTKRRPIGVGEMLKLEYLEPTGITTKKLAAALGNTPEFWLNIQHAVNLWDTRNQFDEQAKNITPLVFE